VTLALSRTDPAGEIGPSASGTANGRPAPVLVTIGSSRYVVSGFTERVSTQRPSAVARW
jgi:hypothetical protein